MESEPIQDAPEDLSMKSGSTPERDPEDTAASTTPKSANGGGSGGNKPAGGTTTTSSSPSSTSPPPSAGFSTSRRSQKFIPPPLDLNARTFHEIPGGADHPRLPKSPGDLPRECLPIRKR